MTKEQVVYLRDEVFKGQPFIVVLDNEHNFMDNYPGRCFPVWDDEREIVSFVESNQESSGMASADYPCIIAYAAYDYIQSIRVLTDRESAMNYLKDSKAVIGQEKYDYNKSIVSRMSRNTRPNHRPYYE